MRRRGLYIASLFVFLAHSFSAMAVEWPDGLLPKQVFRIDVSARPRGDESLGTSHTGLAFAISDMLLITSRHVISDNSRFENILAPNRQIEISYVEEDAPGSEIKTWRRFQVLPTQIPDLVALQIMGGPNIGQMQLSACTNTTGAYTIYTFRNDDLNLPVAIAMEPDATQPTELAGLGRFVVKNTNDRLEPGDIGAPVVNQSGQVVGALSQVSTGSKAVVIYTKTFLELIPDHVTVDCSDRFNSTDYAALKTDFETLQVEVATLKAALGDLRTQHNNEVAGLRGELEELQTELNRTERTAFAAVSAIKDFDEKIDKIDLETAASLVNEFKEGKPIKPRLDQISRDLGDLIWTFRVLPNEFEQTISLSARYRRQLSDKPFSKIMALCVTPLRQPDDLANAPGKDNIENAVFYEERDIELIENGRTPGAKCKKNEHKDPLKQTKSGEYTFNFDAEFDDDWSGLAYVQFYQTRGADAESASDPKTKIVRRMVVGVSIEQDDVKTTDGNMACFDFSKENQRALDAWDDIALFLKTAPDDRDSSYTCG